MSKWAELGWQKFWQISRTSSHSSHMNSTRDLAAISCIACMPDPNPAQSAPTVSSVPSLLCHPDPYVASTGQAAASGSGPMGFFMNGFQSALIVFAWHLAVVHPSGTGCADAFYQLCWRVDACILSDGKPFIGFVLRIPFGVDVRAHGLRAYRPELEVFSKR